MRHSLGFFVMVIVAMVTSVAHADVDEDRYHYCKSESKSKTFTKTTGRSDLPTEFQNKCPFASIFTGISFQNPHDIVIVPKKINDTFADLSSKVATDFGTGKIELDDVHVFCRGESTEVPVTVFGTTYDTGIDALTILYRPFDTNDNQTMDGDEELEPMLYDLSFTAKDTEEAFVAAFSLDSGEFGFSKSGGDDGGDFVSIVEDCDTRQIYLQSLDVGTYSNGAPAEDQYTFHLLMDLQYFELDDTNETMSTTARIVVGDGVGGTAVTPTQQASYGLTDDELPSRGTGVAPGGRATQTARKNIDASVIKAEDAFADVTDVQALSDSKSVTVIENSLPFIMLVGSDKLYGEFKSLKVLDPSNNNFPIYTDVPGAQDLYAILKNVPGDTDDERIGEIDLNGNGGGISTYEVFKICENPTGHDDAGEINKRVALTADCGNVTINANVIGDNALLPNN